MAAEILRATLDRQLITGHVNKRTANQLRKSRGIVIVAKR
jgi:hypothetical protein